jgi:hypothetical protein
VIGPPITDGLVAHYTFDETSGSVAADSTALSADGILLNFPSDDSQWVLGQIDGALELDGDDDWVRVAYYVKPETSATVSAWVFADTRPKWSSIIKNWGGNWIGQFHFGLGGNTGRLDLHITQLIPQKSVVHLREDVLFPVLGWQHVAFVVDAAAGEVRMYRNGVLVETDNTYGGTLFVESITPMAIGTKTCNDGISPWDQFWDGKFDDFGLWTTALSADEIGRIYEAGLEGCGVDSLGD